MQFDLEFNEPEATADSNEKEPGADDVNPRRKKQKETKKNNLAKITNHRDVNIEISAGRTSGDNPERKGSSRQPDAMVIRTAR